MRHIMWKRILFLSLSIICVLSFALIGSAAPCGNLAFPEGSDSPYRSLADALTTKGYSAEHLPTWIPEDYTIISVSDKSNSKMLRIAAEYESTRGILQIRALINSSNALGIAEKDSGGYTLVHNGMDIYVYTNEGNYRATWFADDILFTVSDYSLVPNTITEREFLTIIQSIPR